MLYVAQVAVCSDIHTTCETVNVFLMVICICGNILEVEFRMFKTDI